MSLDLSKVVNQVGGMVARLKDAREERQKHLQSALDVVGGEAIDLDALKKKIAASKTTWLVADLVDGLASHYGAPLAPPTSPSLPPTALILMLTVIGQRGAT